MNTDGLSNVINSVTGLGVPGYDSLETTTIGRRWHLDRELLDNCFESLWQCRKVCEYLPMMMRRSWGTLTLGDGNPEIITQSNNHLGKLKSLYQQGQTLANLYGGSTVIRFCDDGVGFDEPIERDRINYINYSRVYDTLEIQPDPDFIAANPLDPEYYVFYSNYRDNFLNTYLSPFGLQRSERVYTKSIQMSRQYKIHKSRVLRFRGAYLSPQGMRDNRGWEASVLEEFLTPLLRYLNSMGYVGEAMRTFETIVFEITGLFQKSQSSEGESELKRRLRLNQQLMSVMRSLAIDKNTEGVNIVGRQFTGVADILDRLRDEMIGASGLTKPQFYQEHPSGLAATGESERLAEANAILALCDQKWSDNIKTDAELYLLSQESPTRGQLPPDWGYEWKSLYAKTPTEESDIREKTAKTDSINIQMGIYSSEEARESHYGGSEFDMNVSLSADRQVGQLKDKVAKSYGLTSDRLDSLTLGELIELNGKHLS